MKHFFRTKSKEQRTKTASLKDKKSLLFALCSLFFIYQASAQTLPTDPKLRYGKLPNGLTYYIRHNEYPKQRAEFYIAQRVGSVLEEEKQRGLAHFLEHIAFNGTEHFAGTSLRDYLERIGVKFGENLNAYTSFDETVYNLSNVPTIRDGITDSCLLILHDWSARLTLDSLEIEKERGVIREEWRTRNTASNRIWEKILPCLFPNSRYGERMPIGLIDVVNNFKNRELRDYYRRWYRPDLQAIVVVGDLNVDTVEAKIKRLFADIPKPENAAVRNYFPVPDNREPIICLATDPEATTTTVGVLFKHNPAPEEEKNTEWYYLISYLRILATSMLNARLEELTQKPNPPFIAANADDREYIGVAKTKDAWQLSAICKDGGAETALQALLRENRRLQLFGFTPSEYARARADLLRSLETRYNERNNERNRNYVQEYLAHFTDNEPAPGIEFDYPFFQQIASVLEVKDVNEYLKILSDTNQVVMISGPEKAGVSYPSEAEVRQLLAQVSAETLTPYRETLSNEPLVPKLPKRGKILATTENPAFGTRELRLSNGARVILKKTDFKEDEILFSAFSFGGLSLTPEKDIPSAMLMDEVIPLGGLGKFNAIDLQKTLAGKNASVSFRLGNYNQALNGTCSPKDTETLLQLLYLSFTDPRTDRDAYQSYLERKQAQLENRRNNPMTAFGDSITAALYGKNPYAQPFTTEQLSKVDYSAMLETYRNRLADASSYTFIFTGNIDEPALLPLIEQYIAALPAAGADLKSVPKRLPAWRDIKLTPRQGDYTNRYERELQTPKTTVFAYWNGTIAYNLRNNLLLNAVMQIMNIVYTEKIREDEGGTYGVRVRGDMNKIPSERFYFQLLFDTDPQKADHLLAIAYEELARLQTEGVSEANWQKVREFMLKKHRENLEENAYWLTAIKEHCFSGMDSTTDYEQIVQSITPAEIRDFARTLFSQGNRIEIVQKPKTE